jgi:uncharacterized protein
VSKRNDQLFDYLVRISDNIQQAAEVFERELKAKPLVGALANEIKEFEKKGDELTSGIITLLNATYITPLDREDILQLAMTMDDIIDGLDACTVRFDLYNVQEMTPIMIEFATTIKSAVAEVVAAIGLLKARKLMDIRKHVGEINRLEKRSDQLLRHCLRNLFSEPHEPLEVIKLKEIYEILESISDRCEDVADVLESVIIKNA